MKTTKPLADGWNRYTVTNEHGLNATVAARSWTEARRKANKKFSNSISRLIVKRIKSADELEREAQREAELAPYVAMSDAELDAALANADAEVTIAQAKVTMARDLYRLIETAKDMRPVTRS